jgi:ferritin-like protein
MKKYIYYINIDLDVGGIEAESAEQALELAKEEISQKNYNLYVADQEEVEE